MNILKDLPPSSFYPNECFICKATNRTAQLIRCECQMISYCSMEHKEEHRAQHKDLCEVISATAKRKGCSHIFEKQHGTLTKTWIQEKERVLNDVESKVGRSLSPYERQMFLFPRSCFVCYESRQEMLTDCLNCSTASFCQEHQNSPLHDAHCAKMDLCQRLNTGLKSWTFETLLETATSFTERTPMSVLDKNEPLKLPGSMNEYFEHYVKSETEIPDLVRAYASEYLSEPLTLLKVLKSLNATSDSELLIHIGGCVMTHDRPKFWELLLHLLPHLAVLNIAIFSQELNQTLETELCDVCRSNNKKLNVETVNVPYWEYVENKNYSLPILVAIFNADFQEDQRNPWERVSGNLVITITTEKIAHNIRESLRWQYFGCFICSYNGTNDFSSLWPHREWQTENAFTQNQHMIVGMIIKGQEDLYRKCTSCGKMYTAVNSKALICISCNSTKIADRAIAQQRGTQFYAGLCYICHSSEDLQTCSRCKMIWYCSKAHQVEHWPKHKDLCQVISALVKESGVLNLFDNMPNSDSETWLQAKINVMLKVQSRLGRELVDYEQQMFQFPKTCIECHASNQSALITCKCQASYCKKHKDSPKLTNKKHKKVCSQLLEALNIKLCKPPLELLIHFVEGSIKPLMQTVPHQTKQAVLSQSMDSFINVNKNWLQEDFENECKVNSDLYKYMLSEYLTRPLTLLNVTKKLNWPSKSEIIIHVIGSNGEDLLAVSFWEILLHWLPHLTRLKLMFVGPTIVRRTAKLKVCQRCTSLDKILESENHNSQYKEYFDSASFVKPDIIVGYNLDIHESEFGLLECTWKETMVCLTKVNVPFILTSGSVERAAKDHKRLGILLEKPANYFFCDKNPFASLVPERDFETERLRYSNQYVTIYTELRTESEIKHDNTTKKNKRCSITVSDLEKPLASVQIKDSELTQRNDENGECNAQAIDTQNAQLKTETPKSTEIEYKTEMVKTEDDERLKKNRLLKDENMRLKQLGTKMSAMNARMAEENCKLSKIDGAIKKRLLFETNSKGDEECKTMPEEIPIESNDTENLKNEMEPESKRTNCENISDEDGLVKENRILKEGNIILEEKNKKMTEKFFQVVVQNYILKKLEAELKETVLYGTSSS